MFEQGGALILPKMVSPPSRPAVWASETSSDMVHSALRGGVAARRVSNNGAIGKRAADRRSMNLCHELCLRRASTICNRRAKVRRSVCVRMCVSPSTDLWTVAVGSSSWAKRSGLRG